SSLYCLARPATRIPRVPGAASSVPWLRTLRRGRTEHAIDDRREARALGAGLGVELAKHRNVDQEPAAPARDKPPEREASPRRVPDAATAHAVVAVLEVEEALDARVQALLTVQVIEELEERLDRRRESVACDLAAQRILEVVVRARPREIERGLEKDPVP